MKRAAFLREEHRREATYAEWARAVLERRGEAPYELMCLWREAYGVDARAPYANTHMCVDDNRDFYLCANDDDNTVLMYARAGHVTLYHESRPAKEYAGWSTRSAGQVWPWQQRALPENSLLLIPVEVWDHFHSVCFDMEDTPAMARSIAFARMPLCKRWIDLWVSPRLDLNSFWGQTLRNGPPCMVEFVDTTGPPLAALMRVLNMFKAVMGGTASTEFSTRLMSRLHFDQHNSDNTEVSPDTRTITFTRRISALAKEVVWVDVLHTEPDFTRSLTCFWNGDHSMTYRITSGEEFFQMWYVGK